MSNVVRPKIRSREDSRVKLGWLPGQVLADHSTLRLGQMVLEAGEPDPLAVILRYSCDSRKRETRQDNFLHVLWSRTETDKK